MMKEADKGMHCSRYCQLSSRNLCMAGNVAGNGKKINNCGPDLPIV